jgi:hypothetical protein
MENVWADENDLRNDLKENENISHAETTKPHQETKV